MTLGLFIPCYVVQFYLDAAKATLQLLEKLGVGVVYPPNQTACGQPMANSLFEHLTGGCNESFIKNFAGFDMWLRHMAAAFYILRLLMVKQHCHHKKYCGSLYLIRPAFFV
jgi:L-lactate dehydrogenase complex protein LldE